jgi:REP element-mobilizing transposase RayT
MAQTYLSLRIHLVWATRRRQQWIDPEWRPRLWAYMATIVAAHRGRLLCAGGVRDHVHLYVELPANLTVADLVSTLKVSTTKWIRRTFPHRREFAWQSGFGAFTVSGQDDSRLRDHIRHQDLHHEDRSFTTELIDILERHGIMADLTQIAD